MSWIFTPEDRREMREAADALDPSMIGEGLSRLLDLLTPRPEPRVTRQPKREVDWR